MFDGAVATLSNTTLHVSFQRNDDVFLRKALGHQFLDDELVHNRRADNYSNRFCRIYFQICYNRLSLEAEND